jgi:small-conductance mechanosensitive channel
VQPDGPAILPLAVLTMSAAACHWALGRVRRRLPLLLTRHRLDPRAAHPDARYRRVADLVVPPLTAAVWAAALWAATRVSPPLDAARAAVTRAARTALTAPLFAMDGRSYAALDLLAIPVLLGLLWWILGVGSRLVHARLAGATGIAPGAQQTLATLARLVLTGVGALIVLQAWGIDVRGLAIVASVLGVGIGFGLQHLANNLVSGLEIGLERPVKPGDYISVGDLRGTVERIGARSVEIVTRDRVSILIPNARLLEQEIVNWSHGDPTCRIQVPVGVAYGSDVRAARAALLEAAAGHPRVLADPRPSVELRAFGDSALQFELEVWTRDPRGQHELASDLNYRIEAALRRHGVSVPFPQRDLHLRSPDLAAIALAVARRFVGDEALAAARAMLDAGAAAPAADTDDIAGEPPPRTWDTAQLAALVARLRHRDGLAIADRRHRLASYPRCFVGREAVDWLVAHEGLTRDEAVTLGQLLVSRGVIHHVLDEHPFRDGDLFYRFACDESSSQVGPCEPAPAA